MVRPGLKVLQKLHATGVVEEMQRRAIAGRAWGILDRQKKMRDPGAAQLPMQLTQIGGLGTKLDESLKPGAEKIRNPEIISELPVLD